LGVLKEEDMKFKILIDATTIENKKDGLSQYIIAIINHLPDLLLKYLTIPFLLIQA
jgi:hypothetical protein